jgi:streptogrisin C
VLPFPWEVDPEPVGGPVCHSGATSGWICGVVEATNPTIVLAGGMITGLTRSSVRADSGDSGGSVVSTPTPNNDVQAQGIGPWHWRLRHRWKFLFQPITEVLNTHGLALY